MITIWDEGFVTRPHCFDFDSSLQVKTFSARSFLAVHAFSYSFVW